jgi:transposase
MYIARVPNRKSKPTLLLRRSVREGSKVRTETLANLTDWDPARIAALERVLKGDIDNNQSGKQFNSDELTSGEIFGTLFALKKLADQIGITRVLGTTRHSKLSLFLILARIAHGGSRLSAVRWGQQHAVSDILDLAGFDEDDLYEALSWLASQQERIEIGLYQAYLKEHGTPPALMLYDVTSSYFEGDCNDLAQYGYNRDGKHGRKQIVIGLLTAVDGEPIAIRVFEGNTSDPTTIPTQIECLKTQFGITEVVLVGDRGMIKTKGKAALNAEGWRYITALTDAQVRTLLKQGVLQTDIFDSHLCEVEHDEKRLIVRRNEGIRLRESQRREDKLKQLQEKISERNAYVINAKRANAQKGLDTLVRWVKSHKLGTFVTLSLQEREIIIALDETAKQENALLDGCYILETNVTAAVMSAVDIDARYRDLQKVERDFRTIKTSFLEIRPIFLRRADRTRAHVFVAMLALKITRRFESLLRQAFGTTENSPDAMTMDDVLVALNRLTYLYQDCNGQRLAILPRPDKKQSDIFDALGFSFPRNS